MPANHARTLLEITASGSLAEPLNIDQIDNCIAEYEFAQRNLEAAETVAKEAKRGLIALVQAQGSQPPRAEQSWRIHGRRNQATITIANVTSVNSEAVESLRGYLALRGLEEIFAKLFATVIKYTLLKGAKDVLASVKIAPHEHNRIAQLFGLCIETKPKAAALTIELINAEKPIRTPRAGKVAA